LPSRFQFTLNQDKPVLWRDSALALIEHGRLMVILREHQSAVHLAGVAAPRATVTTPGWSR
jgi:hypothetical protein